MCLFGCMHSHFIFIYFFVFVLLNFFCDSEASTPAPRIAFPLSIGYAHCVFSHSPYCTQVTAAADRSFSWTETIACFSPEKLFNDPVFQGVIGNDCNSAARLQHLHYLRKERAHVVQ